MKVFSTIKIKSIIKMHLGRAELMKKYVDFMNEISADELYKGLLAYGFFSEKILPIFTSEPFFNYFENLTKSFENKWEDYI